MDGLGDLRLPQAEAGEREGDREALIREYRLTIAGEVVGGVLKRVEGLVAGPRPVYSETGSSFQRGQSDKESQHG